ncbi:hypothetical protein OEZ85_003991 [Tetradesmus obliquus]|uniref:Leucine-binding protein domain-containing protein n=1 Tax=Tetradesmus obliquus TaxID=3088 RepID=A0ABY8UDC2_TETOB|nr:hypothetical protein OEZ85_003991 [Tetradesmus obliquus]
MPRSPALVCCLLAALAALAASQADPKAVIPPWAEFKLTRQGAEGTVKIGCILPFSGDNAVKGNAARNGIIMAINAIAAEDKFGLPKLSFELSCKDTGCNANNSAAAAAELKNAGVVAVIGDVCSSASLAAKDALNPILLMSPSSTSDKLTIAGDNFLRTVAPDRFQSRILAVLVRGNTTTIKKAIPVVLVYEANTYGQGLADGFAVAYKKLTGRIRFNRTVTPTNAKSIATELANSTATRVVIATNNNTWVAEFLAAGAAIPTFRPAIFAGDAQLNPDLPSLVAGLDGSPALLSKLQATAYNQGTGAFRAKYKAFTNDSYTGHAAHAFDALNALMIGYAMDSKSELPKAISLQSAIKANIKAGVSGNIKFDATGDLIPDNTAYQSIRYVGGKVVLGPFLPLPPAK